MTNSNELTEAASSSLKKSGRYGRIIKSDEGGFRWMPYCLTFDEVKSYYNENFIKDEIPYLNKDGDLKRMNRLFEQMPKQDIDAHFCTSIKPPDRVCKHSDFTKMRNSKFFDVGIPRRNENYPSLKCSGCPKQIEMGSFYIQSMLKFNQSQRSLSVESLVDVIKDSCWHPRCFKCNRCNESLVDLAHCVFKNKLFCMRHFDEQFRPRCTKCQEVS